MVRDGFEEREHLFETRYAYDDGLLFRIRTRRDRLAGLWAAGLIGLSGAAAEDYAAALMGGGATGPGGHNIRDRIIADLRRHEVSLSDHRIDKNLARLLEEARRRIMEG